MSFDKTKAMRNAERFLSQGKIRSAISEYQRVVANDPKDYSTLNILGDLHVKNSEKQEALGCFTQVAEYYNKQGFSQKAIAIYNKISRIEPDSMETSAKLAQLYKSKGSLAEARAHYITLAEQYQRRGQKIEALAIWKQVAELDPSNSEIYLKIAETCRQEDQQDESAEAFTEAGLRLFEQELFEEALTAFTGALEIKRDYSRALIGWVKTQINLGDADIAAKKLEEIQKDQPSDKDILPLLVDCRLNIGDPVEAEEAVVKLVQQEPSKYPKFLEIVKLYLKSSDVDSAARVLSTASETLLSGGQTEDCLMWTNEILARNPEQLDALRLLARYYAWQRDQTELKKSLERLAEVAQTLESVEDERYALSQLTIVAPHEPSYSKRLQELSSASGIETIEVSSEINLNNHSQLEIVESTKEETLAGQYSGDYNEYELVSVQDSLVYETNGSNLNGSSNGIKEFDFYNQSFEASIIEDETNFFESSVGEIDVESENIDESGLKKELESIEFYVEQGYIDLARKTLDSLEEEYGEQTEFDVLRLQIDSLSPEVSENSETALSESFAEPLFEVTEEEPEFEASGEEPKQEADNKGFTILEELKEEFDVEESEAESGSDYETHYQMAVAYQEMGLMETAIRSFQEAINLTSAADGTRRFFKCSSLLGHCFMEKQMPNLAIMWYKRALETPDLVLDERHAMLYELGVAYEAGGDSKKAVECFEQIYAVDVDYRGVGERLQNLRNL